jgi:hypothetical protein
MTSFEMATTITRVGLERRGEHITLLCCSTRLLQTSVSAEGSRIPQRDRYGPSWNAIGVCDIVDVHLCVRSFADCVDHVDDDVGNDYPNTYR